MLRILLVHPLIPLILLSHVIFSTSHHHYASSVNDFHTNHPSEEEADDPFTNSFNQHRQKFTEQSGSCSNNNFNQEFTHNDNHDQCRMPPPSGNFHFPHPGNGFPHQQASPNMFMFPPPPPPSSGGPMFHWFPNPNYNFQPKRKEFVKTTVEQTSEQSNKNNITTESNESNEKHEDCNGPNCRSQYVADDEGHAPHQEQFHPFMFMNPQMLMMMNPAFHHRFMNGPPPPMGRSRPPGQFFPFNGQNIFRQPDFRKTHRNGGTTEDVKDAKSPRSEFVTDEEEEVVNTPRHMMNKEECDQLRKQVENVESALQDLLDYRDRQPKVDAVVRRFIKSLLPQLSEAIDCSRE